jgi:hypothetical protein
MKMHKTTTRSRTTAPFTCKTNLIGAFHKWFGPNGCQGMLGIFTFLIISNRSDLALIQPNNFNSILDLN